MSYQFLDASGATRYASATGAGTSGDPDIPIVISRATNYFRRLAPADITATPATVDGITLTNLHSLKLGSTNGTNYTNYANAVIGIPLAEAGYRDIEIMFYASNAAYHNTNITLELYTITDFGSSITSVAGAKVASILLPQSAYIYFTLSSGGAVGQGGVVGGATAAAGVFYSVPALANAPFVKIKLIGAGLPTSGAFDSIAISRTS